MLPLRRGGRRGETNGLRMAASPPWPGGAGARWVVRARVRRSGARPGEGSPRSARLAESGRVDEKLANFIFEARSKARCAAVGMFESCKGLPGPRGWGRQEKGELSCPVFQSVHSIQAVLPQPGHFPPTSNQFSLLEFILIYSSSLRQPVQLFISRFAAAPGHPSTSSLSSVPRQASAYQPHSTG